jgi:hypothetical protein
MNGWRVLSVGPVNYELCFVKSLKKSLNAYGHLIGCELANRVLETLRILQIIYMYLKERHFLACG